MADEARAGAGWASDARGSSGRGALREGALRLCERGRRGFGAGASALLLAGDGVRAGGRIWASAFLRRWTKGPAGGASELLLLRGGHGGRPADSELRRWRDGCRRWARSLSDELLESWRVWARGGARVGELAPEERASSSSSASEPLDSPELPLRDAAMKADVRTVHFASRGARARVPLHDDDTALFRPDGAAGLVTDVDSFDGIRGVCCSRSLPLPLPPPPPPPAWLK